MSAKGEYYLPEYSLWPILTAASLFVVVLGLVLGFHGLVSGRWLALGGLVLLLFMIVRWFTDLIGEGERNLHTLQVDAALRVAMGLFLFAEAMLFAALIAALFYFRVWTVDWLSSGETLKWLWPGYAGGWPSAGPGKHMPEMIAAGANAGKGQFSPIYTFGLPLASTFVLLASGVSLFWAQRGLIAENRATLIVGLFLAIALGIAFIAFRAYEYVYAITMMGLGPGTGVYGASYFMLTGLHSVHVVIGVTLLLIALVRSLRGHYGAERHFGFEAVVWFWYLACGGWFGLFVYVYWLAL